MIPELFAAAKTNVMHRRWPTSVNAEVGQRRCTPADPSSMLTSTLSRLSGNACLSACRPAKTLTVTTHNVDSFDQAVQMV
jgi:hypothetical protein